MTTPTVVPIKNLPSPSVLGIHAYSVEVRSATHGRVGYRFTAESPREAQRRAIDIAERDGGAIQQLTFIS